MNHNSLNRIMITPTHSYQNSQIFQRQINYGEQISFGDIGISQNINLSNNFLSIPTNTDNKLNVISDYRNVHLGINQINPNTEYYNESFGTYKNNTVMTPQKQIHRKNTTKTTYATENMRPMKVLPTKYLPTKIMEGNQPFKDNEYAIVVPLKNFYITKNVIPYTKKIQQKSLNEYYTNKINIPSSNNVKITTSIQPDNNANSKNNDNQTIPITNIPYSTEEYNINNYHTQTQDISQTLNYGSENDNDYSINEYIEIPPTNTESFNNIEMSYENENQNIKKENHPAYDDYKEYIPNSYIYDSPQIKKKVGFFSPVPSPESNFEIRSYNQDSIIYKLENELFNLKAENESFKKQLQEFARYKSEAEEVKTLREKVDKLAILKENMEEMASLKAQLKELNELKLKIKELEKFRVQAEQMNSNSIKKSKFKSFGKNTKTIKEAKKKIEAKENPEPKREKIIDLDIDRNIDTEENKKIYLKEKEEFTFEKINIFHSTEELKLLIRKINKISKINKKITLNLIYKATADSDRADVFHKKCDKAKNTLVLIETDKGKRFGGYTSVNWKGECVCKKDKNAFVFSLDKMKIYENIPGEDAIGCYPKFGPVFLGCQIRIYDNAFKKGGTTYEKGLNYRTTEDFELTGGDRVFYVKEIEVYEVIPQ